ncbi:MAG: class I SAM-dependent methyltransferase [Candidatus Omnitrophica bacterium]|nr:class I SAM-dependent methyltransferase [Candidatus Omnitrophota bacterium]
MYYPKQYHFSINSKSKLRTLWNILECKIFYQPVLEYSLRILKSIIDVKPEKGTVLDIGCGNGSRISKISSYGYVVEGIDFVEENVYYAKNKLKLNVRQADIEAEGILSKIYSVIMVFWVLEHLVKPKELIKKVYTALLPGGWGIFAVPLADSLSSALLGKSWTQIKEAPRHTNIPTQKGMVLLLNSLGFEKVRIIPALPIESAVDIALSLWPRGLLFKSINRNVFLGIADRIIVGILTAVFFIPVFLLNAIYIKTGLVIFCAQKTDRYL